MTKLISIYPHFIHENIDPTSRKSLCLLLQHADVLYLPEEVDWVKFNVDMSGYYMVHYAGEGWNSIIKVLQHNHTALTSNDRASLIQNVFQLVRSVQRSVALWFLTQPNAKKMK